jgi:hypothetical protein
MIVERTLPQLHTESFSGLVSGCLLQVNHKWNQVAALISAFRQQMDVIGHDAPCMQEKVLRDSQAANSLFQPYSLARIAEMRMMLVAANRHEEPALAFVERSGKTDGFALAHEPQILALLPSHFTASIACGNAVKPESVGAEARPYKPNIRRGGLQARPQQGG